MNALGWRAVAMAGGIALGMALATGAYFSTKFLIEFVVQVKTARGSAG